MKHISSKISELYTHKQEKLDKNGEDQQTIPKEEKPWNEDVDVSGVKPGFEMSEDGFKRMMKKIEGALNDRELNQLRRELKRYV